MSEPNRAVMNWMLFNNQCWVHRPSLLAWLEGEIRHCADMAETLGPVAGREWTGRKNGAEFFRDQLLTLSPEAGDPVYSAKAIVTREEPG